MTSHVMSYRYKTISSHVLSYFSPTNLIIQNLPPESIDSDK